MVALGLAVAVFALGGGASVAATRSSESPQQAGVGGLWQAHTLPGDKLLTGPVLLDHRAVWVEAGHRLLVRSIDASGRTRTIFSTSAAPGAPKGTQWPFSATGLVAGDGRVAFLEEITACGSAPPRTPTCVYGSYGPPTDSITVFAGRPGAIKPVESWLQPSGCWSVTPSDLGIADQGLVDYETSGCPLPRGISRLVLRSFSGRFVRVLARGLVQNEEMHPRFLAAGGWAAFIQTTAVYVPEHLEIFNVKTGRVAFRLTSSPLGWDGMALGRSGRFALMSYGPTPQPCQSRNDFEQIGEGEIGSSELQVLSTQVAGTVGALGGPVVGDRVAYVQATGSCANGIQVAIGEPGAAPVPVPGPTVDASLSDSLAFDGRMVATANKDTVQLARVPG